MGRLAPAPIRHPVTEESRVPTRGPRSAQNPLATKQWTAWFTDLHREVNAAPNRMGTVSLTAQAAAITATAVPVTQAIVAGMYRVSYLIRVTRAATTSSALQVTMGWTDGGVALTNVGASLTGNTTSTLESVSFMVRADAGSTISYAVSYASTGATAMQYALDVQIERLP